MAEEDRKFLPVVALRGRVALPQVTTSFDAGRLITLAAVKNALDRSKLVIAVAQRDENMETVGANDLYEVGTVFSISRVSNLPGNRVRVTGKALYRVKISDLCYDDKCMYAV